MCGIVAMLGLDGPVDPGALDRAVQRLHHRGPDAARTWVSPERHVGLGHARLSIIDLATGDQPIASEDGRSSIVVNGEFYDHERLQRGLVERGHALRTRSDSEVALHLYEERGADCLADLRGEFAFVVWDGREQVLFAARDRFGIKPLYYAAAGGVLMLASEIKAFAAAGMRLRWDHDSVFAHLFACAASDRSLFDGVRQLPPGHHLTASNGRWRVARYWDVDYPRAPRRPPTAAEENGWIERLRGGVEEAVRLRMRADVPVGCLLSGGLDSSSALGLARKFSAGPLAAFTIAFDHEDYDESAVARETAAHVGARFHSIRVTDVDFAEHFADAVWHAEAFHYNAHGTARYLLSRAVRDAGYKVVLAGEGADELAAGYQFCEKALTSEPPGGAFAWARVVCRLAARRSSMERQIAAVSPWLVRAARVIGFPEAMTVYMAEKIETMREMIAPDFLAAQAGRDPFKDLFRTLDAGHQLRGREPVKQLLYLWMKTAFTTYVLAGERLDMAHGVELRLPFLDHHLFELAREIPGTLFVRDGRQKWVLREAMRPHVLERVRVGRKQPFVAPPSSLREGSALFALAQDTLRGGTLASIPFVDRSAVVRLLDRLGEMSPARRADHDPLLLMLLSACVLHERYRL